MDGLPQCRFDGPAHGAELLAAIDEIEGLRKCSCTRLDFFQGLTTGSTGWRPALVGSVRHLFPPFGSLYPAFAAHFRHWVENPAPLC